MSIGSSPQKEQSDKAEIAGNVAKAMVKVVLYIVLYVAVAAIIQWLFTSFMLQFGINIVDYIGYIQVLLAIAFGYLIVSGIASFFYWSMRAKYEHATAAAVRNIVKIIGVGALVAAIAGGAAGVALGGFIGIVIGFASQQILGQAVAGLFLLISRPYKIGDPVVLSGEDGVVDDVTTLFTAVMKGDGTRVLIPNNSIVGSKIYLKPKS